MLTKLLLACLAASTVACAVEVPEAPPAPAPTPQAAAAPVCDSYEVQLDARISGNDWVEPLAAALVEWNSALHGLLNPRIVVTDAPQQTPTACVIIVVPATPEQLGATGDWTGIQARGIGMKDQSSDRRYGRILTRPDVTVSLRKAVLRHELGHVIGLEHSTDPKSVMNPDTDDATKDNTITADDQANACAIWHC